MCPQSLDANRTHKCTEENTRELTLWVMPSNVNASSSTSIAARLQLPADDWKCWLKFKGLPLSPEVTRRHGDGTIVRKMATRLLVAGAVLTMMLLAVKNSGDVALTQTTGTPVGHGMFLSRHEMNDMSLRKLREDHDMLTKRLSCVLCADERARER